MSVSRSESAWGDVATLAWLDLHVSRNAWTRIRREPLRFVAWFFWIGFFFWKLVLQPHGIGVVANEDVTDPIDIAASALLLVAALSLVRGEHPAIAFFASPLEAYWMSGSRIRPWVLVMYLHLRNILQRLPAFTIFLVFVLSHCMPATQSLPQVIIDVLTVGLVTACSRVFSLPRELAPRAMYVPLIGIGLVAGLYAIVSGIEGVAHLLAITHRLPAWLPELHPGAVFVYGARGDLRILLVAVLALAFCFLSLMVFSRDRYPELYDISRAGWEVRSRFHEGRLRRKDDETVVDQTARELARIPSGAGVLLWANWQMFRRLNPPQWLVIRPVLAVACGAIVASLHLAPSVLAGTLGVMFGLTTTFSSLLDATRIGITIRHPIFWLTGTSFTLRLTMISLGWYWRSALDIVLFGFGNVLFGVKPADCLLVVLMAVVGVWLQRCIGLAAFAILPSKIDIGGPIALARFALAVVLAGPPIGLGIVAALVLHAKLPGYAIGAVLAIIEAQLLIYCSGRLLEGRFDKILGG